MNSRCSTLCQAQSYIFFGTVNSGSVNADCYCGNTLTYVTIASGVLASTSGEAGEVCFFLPLILLEIESMGSDRKL